VNHQAPAVAVVPPSPPNTSGATTVKRRRPRRVLGLLVLAVLAGIVGYVAWNLGTTETVDTPKLAGMSRSEALNALEQAGLTMKVVDEQYSEKRDAGTVISSDPAAGEKVAANGTVSVVMSKGPERYRVPKVRGMNQESASQALGAVNLQTGQVLQDYSRKVPEGQVIRTNPPVGTPLKRDTEVALTISLGPEPVVVPDVSNLTVSQAQATLSGAGLKSRTVEQFDETVPFGRVIGTEPSSGTTAYRGDKVRLLVSKGSQYVAVPSVIGLDTESATARLEEAGFRVATEEQFGVTIANRVISQDPSGGTEVASGTLVTLTIT